MRVDFCLPIRNEAEVIENNLLQLISCLNTIKLDFDWKIIGVINGSSDDSALIVESVKNSFFDKLDLINIERPGKGGAIKLCWRRSDAEVLVFMDADLAVSLEAVERLVRPVLKKEADLVISSRFISGASAQRSLQRGIISKSYAFLSRLMLNHKVQDIQCGFKVISSAAFKKIEKFLVDDDWFFDTELVVLAGIAKLKVLEIAVTWRENRASTKKSKIRIFSDSFQFIKKLVLFRFNLKMIKRYFRNV
ncbi:MAG: glycosyltransferase [Patescibacteria group bacterium]